MHDHSFSDSKECRENLGESHKSILIGGGIDSWLKRHALDWEYVGMADASLPCAWPVKICWVSRDYLEIIYLGKMDYSDSGEATCKIVPVHCTALLFDYADSVSDPDLLLLLKSFTALIF